MIPPKEMPLGAVVVSALVLALFALALLAVFMQAIPVTNTEAAMLMIGIIVGKFGTAVDYWLGSSRGSAAKDQQIERTAAALAEKVPAPPPVPPPPTPQPAPPPPPPPGSAEPTNLVVTAPATADTPAQTITAPAVEITATTEQKP